MDCGVGEEWRHPPLGAVSAQEGALQGGARRNQEAPREEVRREMNPEERAAYFS